MSAGCYEGLKLEAFTRLDAPALPVTQPNCDTDQIIPARFPPQVAGKGWANSFFMICDSALTVRKTLYSS